MESTNPKISFIPKGSLVREESFLNRSRPRSVMGFIASAIFVITLGSYVGLYYYNDSLNKVVAEKTTEIKKAQKEFSDAPEVEEAKVFRARVDLAREILNAHTVASPVLAFLSKNTLSSVLYERFTFKDDPVAGSVLELSGEAPTYSALAYQLDTLRAQKKELANVSVGGVSLTNFGTISFTLTLVFNRDYLLYAKSLNTEVAATSEQGAVTESAFAPSINFDLPSASTPSSTPLSVSAGARPSVNSKVAAPTASSGAAPSSTATTSTPLGMGMASSTDMSTSSADWTMLPVEATTTVSAPPVKQSFWNSLWSKLKFW